MKYACWFFLKEKGKIEKERMKKKIKIRPNGKSEKRKQMGTIKFFGVQASPPP